MNIAGIKSIECIPSSKIKLPYLSGNEIDITPFVDGEFEKLDISPEAGPLKADQKKKPAGYYYAVSLPFKIAGLNPNNDKLLGVISRIPHAFRVTDVMGRSYLLGGDGIKVEVDYNIVSGKNGKGLSGYDCKLTTTSLRGLLFLK